MVPTGRDPRAGAESTELDLIEDLDSERCQQLGDRGGSADPAKKQNQWQKDRPANGCIGDHQMSSDWGGLA